VEAFCVASRNVIQTNVATCLRNATRAKCLNNDVFRPALSSVSSKHTTKNYLTP